MIAGNNLTIPVTVADIYMSHCHHYCRDFKIY